MKRNGAKGLSYSVFYEQAADGGYVASVPTLPGCHTQGETREEAERNSKEATALYLESLAAHGETIPEEGPSFQGRVVVGSCSRLKHAKASFAEPSGALPAGVTLPETNRFSR